MRRLSRRMRRHVRDIEGGLGFSWRVPGGSLGRTAIGVLVATCLFAAAGSLVHVRIPFAPGEIRETAQVLILDPSDPDAQELLDWARFHSPFPGRWEPGSGSVLEGMMAELTAELEGEARYHPRLRPLVATDESVPLPGMIADDPAPLARPVIAAPDREQREGGMEVVARSWAAGPLADRWGRRVLSWEGIEAVSHLGREASFMAGVDRDGRVVHCLVMEGLADDLNPLMEHWIRKQVVDSVPGQDEIVWDVVRVLVQTSAEEGRGKGS